MSRFPLTLFARLLVAAAPFCSACDARAPVRPRLVVLFAPCTVAKQSLAPYHDELEFTPNLAAFARESLVFERHLTEAEQSGPAYAALFTGTHANRHGVYSQPVQLADELYLLAECFADGGYETWFWSGHGMGGVRLNYNQGVDPERTIRYEGGQRGVVTEEEARAQSANDPAFDALLARVVATPELDAFVQVNFTLSHGPYTFYSTDEQLAAFCARHPARTDGLALDEIRRLGTLYEANHLAMQWDYATTVERLGLSAEERTHLATAVRVHYEAALEQLDRMFGELLGRIRAAGLEDESLVVFTADHGEVLGRDSALFRWTHGLQLAPESLEIPLMIRAPGLVRPGRYQEVTRSIDVFPTLAGLCGLALPEANGPEGTDLSAALRGERAAPEQIAYVHTTVLNRKLLGEYAKFPPVQLFYPRIDPELIWVGARQKDRIYKLRNLNGRRFGMRSFDLASDPEELHSRFDPKSPADVALAEALAQYKQLLVAGYGRRSSSELSGQEELERLRSLGYVR